MIVDSVTKGDKVTLVGFGSFEKRDRKEREGRNPMLGETLTIAAKSVPTFTSGKLFRDKVADAK
jgi:DNA-binding protein HU-beta